VLFDGNPAGFLLEAEPRSMQKYNHEKRRRMPAGRKIASIITVAFTFVLCILGSVLPACAQKPTAADVEHLVRAENDIWNTNDPVRIAESEFSGLGGFGFGFRSRDLRTPIDRKSALAMLKGFFSTIIYYRGTLDEVHTAVDGDIGLAWGFWTESFQVRGRKPEAVKVRFTATYKHDSKGWQTLLYHRDVQPFDERGQYIPVPVPATK
jgi:hypothetical protein